LFIGSCRPLAQLSQTPNPGQSPSDDQQAGLFMTDELSVQADDQDDPHITEFSIPLRSLRPLAEHDEVWLALRRVTYSGDALIEHEPSSDDVDVL
jgi:hypothetical protein